MLIFHISNVENQYHSKLHGLIQFTFSGKKYFRHAHIPYSVMQKTRTVAFFPNPIQWGVSPVKTPMSFLSRDDLKFSIASCNYQILKQGQSSG